MVDLPEPFGPSSPNTSPRRTSKSTLSTARAFGRPQKSLKTLVRPRTATTTSLDCGLRIAEESVAVIGQTGRHPSASWKMALEYRRRLAGNVAERLSLTPRFSEVIDPPKNEITVLTVSPRVQALTKTVKTVGFACRLYNTLLKQGVNEITVTIPVAGPNSCLRI